MKPEFTSFSSVFEGEFTVRDGSNDVIAEAASEHCYLCTCADGSSWLHFSDDSLLSVVATEIIIACRGYMEHVSEDALHDYYIPMSHVASLNVL